MEPEKLTAAQAIKQIMSICARLKPGVVWSICESSFAMGVHDLNLDFKLTITAQSESDKNDLETNPE